jgi:putative heme-binding domain-containing protein
MQPTEVVIQAVTQPSADIAHGFDGTIVTLKDGTVIHGKLVSSSDPLVVQSMGGFTQLIPADRVEKRGQLRRSLMLSAEQLGFDAQAVADLVAYLKTL